MKDQHVTGMRTTGTHESQGVARMSAHSIDSHLTSKSCSGAFLYCHEDGQETLSNYPDYVIFFDQHFLTFFLKRRNQDSMVAPG